MAKSIITKQASIERQLEAAIYLTLKGFWPEPIHTLIGASRGILYGMHKTRENRFLTIWEQKILARVVPGTEKIWRKYENRVSNFLKHADKDPNDTITDVDLDDLNEIELFVCILAYSSLGLGGSPRILVGFLHCGLLNENWLDLNTVLREAGIDPVVLDEYRKMPLEERREVMLEAFEKSWQQRA